MKKPIRLTIITFTVLVQSIFCFSQNYWDLNYQKIDFCEEQEEICRFIEEFGSTTDPSELKNYIVFPNFITRHMCLAGHDSSLPRTALDPSDTIILTDDEIKSKLNKAGCNNPLCFFQIKAKENRIWEDSIKKIFPSVEAYFFNKEENISNYLEAVIDEYSFPIDFSNSNIKYAGKSDIKFYVYEKNKLVHVPGLRISGYGFQIIELYKINNEYKVNVISYYSD